MEFPWGVPIALYGGKGIEQLVNNGDNYNEDTPPTTTKYNKRPYTYSTKEGYFPDLEAGQDNNLAEAFILHADYQGIVTRPYVLNELPKDGTFKLYNDYGLYIAYGQNYIPRVFIVHKDGSATPYSPTNFEFKVGSFLKRRSYLEYTDIDFSDCIMIGIGAQSHYFD